MSTPKPGWIARDNDGDLFWYSEEPIWVDEYGEWDYGGCDCDWLDRSLYPDLKPGECMQIIDAQQMGRAGAAFEAEAHRKTLAELAALRAQLKKYKEALAEATSCLIDFTELRCGFKGDEENVSNLAIRTMRFFRLLDQKGIDVFDNKHNHAQEAR